MALTPQEKSFRDWLNSAIRIHDVAVSLRVLPHGAAERDSQVYCPFHANTQTPAAKIYVADNRLHCFAEKRDYTVWDFLTLLGGYTPQDLLTQYEKEWGTHQREHLESIRHEGTASLLQAAHQDSRRRHRLQEFQAEIVSTLRGLSTLREWRAGGSWESYAREASAVVTNGLAGYDYASIVRTF